MRPQNWRSTAPTTMLFGLFLGMLLDTVALAQWSPLRRISYAGGGYYSNIVAVVDTLHVAYMATAGREATTYVKSTDGGQSWTTPIMLSDTSVSEISESCKLVLFGNEVGVFWHQGFRNGNNRHNIGYSLSSNGGQSWSAPRYLLNSNADIIGHFDICSTDSILNVIYAEQMGSYIYHFKCIRSTDFGGGWSSPEEIFQAEDSGPVDMVSYGDRVNVVWTGNFDYSRHWEVYHFKSTDCGLSWGASDTITRPSDNVPSEFPKLSVDDTGKLILAWMDFKNSPNQLDGDIFIKQSTDGGTYWSPERQITFTHYVWEPEVVMRHDSIFVAWIDERLGIPPLMVYSIHSTDGGTTWSPEQRMEPEPYFCTNPALAFSNGHAYLVFKDMRCEPDTDVCGGAFFTKYPADPDKIVYDDLNILPDGIALCAYPNPFNSSTFITYSGAIEGSELGIYDIQGQFIKSIKLEGKQGKAQWDGTEDAGDKVASGVYFARLQGQGHSRQVKLIYLK